MTSERITVGLLTILFIATISIAGCSYFFKRKEIKPFVSSVTHPEWTKNMVLYEVNLRQFTEEGTLTAFAGHLPRLKNMGIDVLWFMPIFPIGEVNRKGELGSYYSVRDFMGVNPEFGSIEDFQMVVDSAHKSGMHIILDWVPNHSSWDNRLADDHPEYYVKDSTGKFTPPIGTDWTDVIQLDWDQDGLHDYMIEAMSFWVRMGVDGFRVDHPHNTPVEFWERARAELNKIKPVFLLAEYEGPAGFLEKGFDMTYAWEMHHLMKSIAQGRESAKALRKYFEREWMTYPQNAYRLMFLTNHDENSWAGTVDSLFGNSQKAFSTLIFTASGVPLLYNGQEACLDKKLKFFTKDPIRWQTCNMTDFYTDLIKLKKGNLALWNGESGGPMVKIKTTGCKKIFAFYREKDESRIMVFLNLSGKRASLRAILKEIEGDYAEYFSGENVIVPGKARIILDPWGFKVYVKK